MTASGGTAETPGLDTESIEADRWREGDRPFVRLWRAIRPNSSLIVGLLLLASFAVVGFWALRHWGDGIQVLPGDPTIANEIPPPGPSWAHPFGVMHSTGVDVLSALVQATPIDLALVGGILLVALLVGVLLGGFAGLSGGAIDGVITFVSDLLVVVPPFFLVLVIFLGIQRGIPPAWALPVFAAIFAAVLWPYYARPVRARARQVATETYVEAARASGAPRSRLLWRHILPNSLYPAMAQLPVDVYNIFFVLTVFTFLGCFGGGASGYFVTLTPLPRTLYPEWGSLLANGACFGWSPLAGSDFWWMYAFPAATIVVFGAAVALTADGVERYLRVGQSS
ncbi:MAG: ABC transporter permease subunit [Thermoplasmata archaeon]|nr:ABC transporter permease subunit [Thermoplasmata archaeon]